MAGSKWLWAAISSIILVTSAGFIKGYSKTVSEWSKPIAITRGMNVSYVQFTPDRRLLFVGNDSVMLSNPDGTGSITLFKYPGVRRAVMSPDMQNIVFDDGSDIYAAKADGSNVTPIANNPTILEGGSWFSPDGKRLVYFTIDDKNRVYGIWTMNPDGKNRINVASSEGSQIFRHPRWSPDGTRISFFTISKGVFNISVMNPDGSERVDLTSRSESPSRQASWSPSSKWLVYSRRSKNFDLWLMDTEGKNKMQLTHLPGHEAKPVWSLDGTKIAFLCSRCQRKGKSDLYLISRSR